MKLVRQKHPDGCGVAVFAMLTGSTYRQAAKALKFQPGENAGKGIDFRKLRRALEEDGRFCRTVLLAREVGDGSWPPHPFAPLHFASVTQPSGVGHYVAMDHLGDVFDPRRPGRHKLTDWKVIHEVTGVL